MKKRYNSAYPRYLLSGCSLYEASASIITDMYLIPTPRASAQRLTVSLLVGVELANTLRQLFAQTDSICVYGGNIRDLYHGWFSLTNHVAVLEVSISDIHLVGGVYLDRHLPLRLFA